MLRNVRFAMGEDCQLFIAERVQPDNYRRPHPNLSSNLLMQTLFKAEVHTKQFYQEALDAAGFNLNIVVTAGNYLIFAATEKPELKFQKNMPSAPIPKMPLRPSGAILQSQVVTTCKGHFQP